MDEYSLFTIALGLKKPWKVVDIKFSKDRGRLDLKIDFQKGATFPCPSCEERRCLIYDTKERTWRHLNFFQYETYLHARVAYSNYLKINRLTQNKELNRAFFSFTCKLQRQFGLMSAVLLTFF